MFPNYKVKETSGNPSMSTSDTLRRAGMLLEVGARITGESPVNYYSPKK